MIVSLWRCAPCAGANQVFDEFPRRGHRDVEPRPAQEAGGRACRRRVFSAATMEQGTRGVERSSDFIAERVDTVHRRQGGVHRQRFPPEPGCPGPRKWLFRYHLHRVLAMKKVIPEIPNLGHPVRGDRVGNKERRSPVEACDDERDCRHPAQPVEEPVVIVEKVLDDVHQRAAREPRDDEHDSNRHPDANQGETNHLKQEHHTTILTFPRHRGRIAVRPPRARGEKQ